MNIYQYTVHIACNTQVKTIVLLQTQAVEIMIALVTQNRKVHKKSDSIQEEISETQIGFSDNQ